METEKIFIVPDLHAPYHDAKAWEVCLNAIEEVQPTGVVLIGDVADFYSISRFSKNPSRRLNLEWEVNEVNDELDEVERRVGKHVVFCEGNHERRYNTYIRHQAPELDGISSPQEMFGVKERGWWWIPYGESFKYRKVLYSHDFGFAGKYAMFQTLDFTGQHTVIGHTHRAGTIYKGQHGSQGHFCMNVGHLSDYEQLDYGQRQKAERDGRHGFGIVTHTEDLAYAQFYPILNNETFYEGKRIGL